MILAGDVGGTKTNLGFFRVEGEGPSLRVQSVVEQAYASRGHASLDEIALAFLAEHKLKPSVACFGVAGPVHHGHSQATNLPWTIDAARLTSELNVSETLLINDLEANAWGIAELDDSEFALLNPGAADSDGNAAVISAGTGLGEAGLYWDGQRHNPFACEGGHADFAARNAVEAGLLAFLLDEFGHASWERVLSGPGLHNLYRYLSRANPEKASAEVAREIAAGDPAAAIAQAAHERRCPVCVEAMALFVSLYGAEAGNLALKLMATGGVYIGGGMAPKNVAALQQGDFMRSFAAKGRLRPVLEAIPVRIILCDKTAIVGAARCAAIHSA